MAYYDAPDVPDVPAADTAGTTDGPPIWLVWASALTYVGAVYALAALGLAHLVGWVP